jgi:fatty acid synthase subunit alpha, fungi type
MWRRIDLVSFPSVVPYEAYKANAVRSLQSYKAMREMVIKPSLVKVKEAPPYTEDMEAPVLLNSLARATLNPKTGSYSFPTNLSTTVEADSANSKTVADILAGADSAAGVGVDQGTCTPPQ